MQTEEEAVLLDAWGRHQDGVRALWGRRGCAVQHVWIAGVGCLFVMCRIMKLMVLFLVSGVEVAPGQGTESRLRMVNIVVRKLGQLKENWKKTFS